MKKLSTIQKRENLNDVWALDKGIGDVTQCYMIVKSNLATADYENDQLLVDSNDCIAVLQLQNGARKDPKAIHGITNEDLLEIVRDRLKDFQRGEFTTRENACALTHIEEALMWLNKRVEDRIERHVLGTYEK